MNDHATRDEINKLRSEIQYLRKHPQTLSSTDNQRMLLDSMDRLHGVLEKLITMFETANKEIYEEYDKGMHEESAKLDKLLEQNEKLARGIVALADMVKQQQAPQPKPTAPAATPIPSFTPPKPAFPPEDSFIHQPVTPLPPLGAPAVPPLTPPPALPPLPPPPAPQPTKRGILDKFSFK